MKRRIGTFVAVLAILSGTLYTGVVIAASQAANLDQCANDPATSSPEDGCDVTASQWVNGNLGASKSVYREGDSIAYRMRFANLAGGSTRVHAVVIEYDTTKAGKHAIDYLTSWDRTVETANPCLGVAGCVLASPTSTMPIPVDAQVQAGPTGASGDDIKPGADGTTGTSDDSTPCPMPDPPGGTLPCTGVFTMWGGTLTSVSPVTYPNGGGFAGDKTARVIVNFTTAVGVTNPVLAWGGHIATRQNWPGASAISISGSPYHMRLIDLDGSGGNQDRSLSADAVIFPARITVVKNADGPTAAFSFTGADFNPNPFTLNDGASTTNPTKVSNEILVFGNHTVAETDPLPGYKIGSIACTTDNGSTNQGGTPNALGAGGTATVGLEEGENVTCTFNNVAQSSTALIDKTVVSVKNADGTTDSDGKVDAAGDVINYSITYSNTGNVTLTGVTVSDPLLGTLSCTIDAVSATSPFTLAPTKAVVCTGSYTVSQADINNNGGGDGDIDNTATGDSDQTDPITDSEKVDVDRRPALSIDKADDYGDDPVQRFENLGNVITYTIVVTNTGNTTLTGVNVTDENAPNLDCDSVAEGLNTTGFTIPVGGSLTCSASHTIVQADLDAGHFFNRACADDGVGNAASDCDDEDTPGKAQPTVNTSDYLIPQDSVTLAGLTAGATGDLKIELRINETCGQDATPAWSYVWLDPQNGTFNTADLTGADAQDVTVSTDSVIRWCTEYTGDANNAARPMSDRGEVVQVTFDPALSAALGASVPLLAWFLWSQRKRRRES